jgi:hypothetical protein
MGKPRLPWKRGPAAWHVKCRSEEILAQIAASTRPRITLRGAARLLGLSTQPLRDWIAQGYLCRTGPRLRLSLQELRRFVQLLAKRAEPFDASSYLNRFRDRRGILPYSFKKLATARIVWPKRRTALVPSELAALVGCHSSLVLKAIQAGTLRARRPTPCRWEITRRAWADAFPLAIARQLRLPPLPTTDLVSTAAAAAHLRACGMTHATPELVRALIREGKLAAAPRPPRARKFFILKSSLKAFRLTRIQHRDQAGAGTARPRKLRYVTRASGTSRPRPGS